MKLSAILLTVFTLQTPSCYGDCDEPRESQIVADDLCQPKDPCWEEPIVLPAGVQDLFEELEQEKKRNVEF